MAFKYLGKHSLQKDLADLATGQVIMEGCAQ